MDPKHTVDQIKGYLAANSAMVPPEMASVAADYADLCREANLRLRRCADFLREQLRGEAVAYAETRPALLDFVAALDLRQIAEWEHICGTMNLARPPRLSLDSARELKEAVARQQPLRELLARHRFLALSRASLGERLAVLRQLIEADPTADIWKRDAEDLERIRLADLRVQMAEAVRAADLPALEAMQSELKSQQWISPIADELKEGISRTVDALRQANAIEKLRALVPSVHAAHAAMSYDECRHVFSQWAKVVSEGRLTVPPDLRREIAPLAKWIDDQEERRERQRQFRAACLMAVQAVESHAPLEELKLLYRRVTAFEMDIPDDVASKYRHGLERARADYLRERRRQFGLGAALVGAIIAALTALVFVLMNVGRH